MFSRVSRYTAHLAATDDDAGTRPERADVISYAKSIQIGVQLQRGTTKGRIYPPFIAVDYGTASRSDYEDNNDVEVSHA